MKKYLIISGTIYLVAYVGTMAWMMLKPEQYGEWIGKMTTGIFKAFAKEDEI